MPKVSQNVGIIRSTTDRYSSHASMCDGCCVRAHLKLTNTGACSFSEVRVMWMAREVERDELAAESATVRFRE